MLSEVSQILPIVQALGGGGNDNSNPNISTIININFEMQGRYGNSCCSSQEKQKSKFAHRKVVYHPPASENIGEKGHISPEQKKSIFRCFCCSLEPKKESYSEVGAKFEEYLIASYGEVPTRIALKQFAEEKEPQKQPTIMNEVVGREERRQSTASSEEEGLGAWETQKEQPLTVGNVQRITTIVVELQTILQGTPFYQQLISNTQTLDAALGMRTVHIEPCSTARNPFQSPKKEIVAAAWSPYRAETPRLALEAPSNSNATDFSETPMSLFKLSPARELPPQPAEISRELTIKAPKNLAPVLASSPGHISAKNCEKLYEAILRGELTLILPPKQAAAAEEKENERKYNEDAPGTDV